MKREISIVSCHGLGGLTDLGDDAGLRKIGFYTRKLDLQISLRLSAGSVSSSAIHDG